jgi:hypothetical protein
MSTAQLLAESELKSFVTHDKDGYHGVKQFKSIITEVIVSSRGFFTVGGFIFEPPTTGEGIDYRGEISFLIF